MTLQEPHFARVQPSMYTTLVVLFVSFLLLSNISAVKLIQVGPLVMDGGIFLFPLTYILGDVLAEVYGFAAPAVPSCWASASRRWPP